MSDIKVGDRVRIVRVYRYSTDSMHVGDTGTVTEVDTDDHSLPYNVRLDGESYALWVHSVELIAPEPPATNDRETLVARAVELLKDTPHTGADVIAMAAFLAG